MPSRNRWGPWSSPDHADAFDFWARFTTWELRRMFEGFNEFQMLTDVKQERNLGSLLDLGCATGELYRYLAAYHPDIEYHGVDVSEPAIDRAQQKYPDASFQVVPPDLADLDERESPPDLLWSRDVVHHQPQPFAFLDRILNLGQQVTILRLRTRDAGSTVVDPDRSCQWHYGDWVPYIVMNIDEVTATIQKATPVQRIEYRKRYEVLGGAHKRYLPKECYDPDTGTAETAALIVHGEPEGREPTVRELDRPDGDQGPPFVMRALRWMKRRLSTDPEAQT